MSKRSRHDDSNLTNNPPNRKSPSISSSSGSKKVAASSKRRKVYQWKRPSDKPKRPACAYNLYFYLERERILRGDERLCIYTAADAARAAEAQLQDKPKRKHVKTHGKIAFTDLSKTIASSWNKLEQGQREVFEYQASLEATNYANKLAVWKQQQELEQKETTISIENSSDNDEKVATSERTSLSDTLIKDTDFINSETVSGARSVKYPTLPSPVIANRTTDNLGAASTIPYSPRMEASPQNHLNDLIVDNIDDNEATVSSAFHDHHYSVNPMENNLEPIGNIFQENHIFDSSHDGLIGQNWNVVAHCENISANIHHSTEYYHQDRNSAMAHHDSWQPLLPAYSEHHIPISRNSTWFPPPIERIDASNNTNILLNDEYLPSYISNLSRANTVMRNDTTTRLAAGLAVSNDIVQSNDSMAKPENLHDSQLDQMVYELFGSSDADDEDPFFESNNNREYKL